MSINEVLTALGAVHMRVVYFAEQPEQDQRPEEILVTEGFDRVYLAELARAFRQLELLVEYGELVAAAGTHGLSGLSIKLEISPEELSAENEEQLIAELLEQGFRSVEIKQGHVVVGSYTRGSGFVSVVSVRMGSALEVLLEIPPVVWPGIAWGLLELAERIATTPVRIARKCKEELLKTVVIDKQIEVVRKARADVLAELLLEEGPQTQTQGPDEIVFVDPDDPDPQLEIA